MNPAQILTLFPLPLTSNTLPLTDISTSNSVAIISFIILDEAQNATNEQMKMMLTRIGSGSKIVVNGDITQTDLPSDKESGLLTASKILNNTPGIEVVHFNGTDVLRHKGLK